jgi:hypothetical protein
MFTAAAQAATDRLSKHIPSATSLSVQAHVRQACSRQVTKNDTLWVAMPSWQQPDLLIKAITSVTSQEPSFAHVRVVVFEALSDHMITPTQREQFSGHSSFSPHHPTHSASSSSLSDKDKYIGGTTVSVTFLRDSLSETDPRNSGSAYGKALGSTTREGGAFKCDSS